MNLSTVCASIVLLLFLSMCTTPLLGVPQDEEAEEDEEPQKPCYHYIGDFAKGILNSTLKCLSGRSTFKMKNIFELGTRAICLLKCTLQEEGAIQMDGVFDDIGAALYFEEKFPTEVREIALPNLQACFILAEQFKPKEYYCQSYLPFIECNLKGILSGLIPYGGQCVTYPLLGILFSVLKYLAPESPKVTESMEEMKRALAKANQYKCLDKNCTRLFEYKKINGTKGIVVYDKDMNVISTDTWQHKMQQRKLVNDTHSYYEYNQSPYSSNRGPWDGGSRWQY